jgi:hypothetical protein
MYATLLSREPTIQPSFFRIQWLADACPGMQLLRNKCASTEQAWTASIRIERELVPAFEVLLAAFILPYCSCYFVLLLTSLCASAFCLHFMRASSSSMFNWHVLTSARNSGDWSSRVPYCLPELLLLCAGDD